MENFKWRKSYKKILEIFMKKQKSFILTKRPNRTKLILLLGALYAER